MKSYFVAVAYQLAQILKSVHAVEHNGLQNYNFNL